MPTLPQEKAKILIVDDRPDKLMALETALSGVGDEIVKVTSGRDALRMLLKEEFAVIILDVNMPDMDGFETASLIRQRKSSEHTPIIFVTGINVNETHVTRGYSLGAVDYIFSPVDAGILKAKVSVFIDLYRRSKQLTQRETWQRRQAEQRAASLESRLQSLLDSVRVGVYRFTPEGELIEANRAFLNLLGVTDLEGARSMELQALYALNMSEQSAAAPGDYREAQDLLLRRADGSEVWVSLTKTLVTEDQNKMYVDGLIEDISHRKEAEEALIRKSEELGRSNADLEQFAFIASHDLQEPLRGFSLYTTMLKTRYGDQIDENARTLLSHMESSTERMYVLINDLLSFARINNQEAKRQPVAASEILEKALFTLKPTIEERMATLEIGELPTILGDKVMLSQVFQNLLANSIKFCKERAPHIRVQAERRGDFWEFALSDNGIGIPHRHLERIFGVFKRLHRREEYAGTGIGLALCRKVIERHGGRIWAESEEGVGSTFRFTLPASLEGADLLAPQLERAQGDGRAQGRASKVVNGGRVANLSGSVRP